ncbi:MAG: 7-cyano-7-deazaguanine synthase QueC [Gammaproteobacteria bacterium]|nr:7-cyano-7-deazaguanine synthase QueC [Gammaproteobacteria bacterium]MBU2678586.1 7-cyano-7-deazaguanine synthase QueC [Gammaproteobacteria bacterium]NNC57552.1 7-cyano-7-deazaguanine synthase QueC [Woeseiaceae bacterium]NNL52320.1 7-cyano-7-deazaguanine synthase QueC [Woeseiaceae bacterium]
MSENKALVVLSGGQDSTTCLYWALDRFGSDNVSTVSFDYGQRHRVELECAASIARQARVSNTCLPIDTFAAIGGDALTDNDIDIDKNASAGGLPNTFVPGRNIIFLTFAAAYAYQRGIDNLVTGVAQTDFSGYPDCREATIRALQQTLRAGMESAIVIHTPLMQLSKKETVQLAVTLGALPALALTHTCYEGERPPCGQCPACKLRAKGFAEAGIEDPLLRA